MQFRDVNALISNAADFLLSKLGYSPVTVQRHKAGWSHIKKIITLLNIRHYSQDVGRKILSRRFKAKDIGELNNQEKEFYNSVSMLTEFQMTGKIIASPRMNRINYVFNGPAGEAIVRFLEYKKREDSLAAVRVLYYQRYLARFYQYCAEKKVYSFNKVDLPFVLQFLSELDCKKETPVHTIISSLRNFIKYLFEQKIIRTDFSSRMRPNVRPFVSHNYPQLIQSRKSKNLFDQLTGGVQ